MAVAGLGNPDAPVAVVLLSDGRILMAANTDAISDRSLSLLVSDDQGRSWSIIARLEDKGNTKRSAVRYPDMERLPTGEILLTYSTFSKHGIRAQFFNEAWINSRD